VVFQLIKRALFHDRTKLQKEEKAGFDEYTPKLAGATYGSEEYKKFLEELKTYLNHHYAKNRHHPEHFDTGIKGMNLIDILEMFCDWYAATKRHNDGDIIKSITINQGRFGYSDDLKVIFMNTYRDLWASDCFKACDYQVCREYPSTCIKSGGATWAGIGK
jgi:hypothetical protein